MDIVPVPPVAGVIIAGGLDLEADDVLYPRDRNGAFRGEVKMYGSRDHPLRYGAKGVGDVDSAQSRILEEVMGCVFGVELTILAESREKRVRRLKVNYE
jgi:hypothetical protein